MSFADIDPKDNNNKFQRTTYMDLTPGQHMIRLLGTKAEKLYTHYVNRVSILCLGDDCPICANNKKIILENPDNFRDIKGWASKSKRYFVNVLDRTPVKVCPTCKTEVKKGSNGAFPPTCTNTSCNSFINGVQDTPSNKVKLWGFGTEVAEQLNAFESASPTPMNTYDIMLVVTGTGKERKTNAVPMPFNADVVTVADEDLYALDSGVVKLNPDEAVSLQRGVSLKDIFASRKAATKTDTVLEEDAGMSDEDVAKKIKELFNN